MTAQNAFEAMALSMYYADQSMAEITEATGLSEDEITALVDAQERQFDADTTTDTTVPATSQADTAGIAGLLAWADGHELAGIRNRAARRATEVATRQAEERVAQLKADLEAAQAELRQAKTGRPAAVAPAATPARRGTPGRSREELAAIRTWARANGHTVADHGMIPKAVRAAYTTDLQQAG